MYIQLQAGGRWMRLANRSSDVCHVLGMATAPQQSYDRYKLHLNVLLVH
jgi:hypothetical protein